MTEHSCDDACPRPDCVAAREAVRKAQSREAFAWTVARAPEPDPCRACGRLVLAGRCCDKPDFPPYPPPVAELAQALHDAESERDEAVSKLAESQEWARRNLDLLRQGTTVAERDAAIARAERAEALAAEERERAYGYRDLYRRCGLACGETPDEQPIHAVERVVRQRDAAIARAERAEALSAVGVAAQIRKLLDDGLLNPQHVIHVDAAGRHRSPEEVLADPGMIAQMAEAMTRSLILAAAEDNGLRAHADRAEAQARNFAETVALLREDDAIARAERAEAGLAALREAAAPVVACLGGLFDHEAGPSLLRRIARVMPPLRDALADTEAAAEKHDRRVRVEALREAAAAALGRGLASAHTWLRARADEIDTARRCDVRAGVGDDDE